MRSWQVSIGRDASPKASCLSIFRSLFSQLQFWNPVSSAKGKVFWNKFGSTVWMEGMNLFIFSLPSHVIIGSVCCRNVDVVDCRLLPQTWAGFYIIHGAIGLNILDNVWAISLNFKITPYSAFTASAPLRFLAKGLYTYKSSISFVIVIS